MTDYHDLDKVKTEKSGLCSGCQTICYYYLYETAWIIFRVEFHLRIHPNEKVNETVKYNLKEKRNKILKRCI